MSSAALALTSQAAMEMAVGESDARIAAIGQALESGDVTAAELLQAMSDEAVKVFGEAVWIMTNGQARHAVTGEIKPLPEDAQDIMLNNRLRAEIDTALSAFKLLSPDAGQRIEIGRAHV